MNAFKTKPQNTHTEAGITLQEVVIGIVIVGILTAIAIPIFSTQQKELVGASLKSDVLATGMKVSTAFLDNPSAEDLSALVETVETGDNKVVISGGWRGYTIKATNPNASPSCWQFVSTQQRSQVCPRIGTSEEQ